MNIKGEMTMFCERLKQLRKDARKTQNDVATYLQIRRSTYGEYERGKIVPPYDKIKALADYFEVTVDYLMEDEEKEPVDVCKFLKWLLHELKDKNSKIEIDGNALTKESRDFAIGAIDSAIKLIDMLIQRERS